MILVIEPRNLISLGLETFTPMVTYDSNACQYQITTKTEMVIDRHASTLSSKVGKMLS